MWDYGIEAKDDIANNLYLNDSIIDSRGDIKIVGTPDNNNNPAAVILEEVQTALYVNSGQLVKYLDEPDLYIELVKRIAKQADSRISSADVYFDEDDILRVSIMLNNGETGVI